MKVRLNLLVLVLTTVLVNKANNLQFAFKLYFLAGRRAITW